MQEDPIRTVPVIRDKDCVKDVVVPQRIKVLSGLPPAWGLDSILIREEYDEAMTAIEKYRTALNAVIIVGHPGVGMSISSGR